MQEQDKLMRTAARIFREHQALFRTYYCAQQEGREEITKRLRALRRELAHALAADALGCPF